MKKPLFFGAALALIFGAGFISITSAQDNNQGAENQVITDGTPNSLNPAYFPHRDHQNRLTDCGICHHGKTADGKQEKYDAVKTKKQKCNVCHNKNADGVSLDGKVLGISPIQRAGHGRCWSCHKDKTSTKTPPVQLLACPTCHTKK